MRNLLRNTEPVFFRLYEGITELTDEYGNRTGSYEPQYGELQMARLCVSANKGDSEATQFGTLLDYDRTLTTADTRCPINEYSVLWLDGASPDEPWNYTVKAVSKWRNSVAYAVKRVEVSHSAEN